MPEVNSAGLELSWWRPFLAALLLAGDRESAEIAVLRSLRELPAGGIDTYSLLVGSVAEALRMQREFQAIDERSGVDSSFLPDALGQVMHLAPLPRSCFVLRTLEGLPREICASMLGIDAEAVDHHAGMAAISLAESSEKDGAR